MSAPDGRQSAAAVRDLVLGHLDRFSDRHFSPMELHRVLGPSRDAILRACHHLAATGPIRSTGSHPQRYQANPPTIAPTPAEHPGPDQAGDSQ